MGHCWRALGRCVSSWAAQGDADGGVVGLLGCIHGLCGCISERLLPVLETLAQARDGLGSWARRLAQGHPDCISWRAYADEQGRCEPWREATTQGCLVSLMPWPTRDEAVYKPNGCKISYSQEPQPRGLKDLSRRSRRSNQVHPDCFSSQASRKLQGFAD